MHCLGAGPANGQSNSSSGFSSHGAVINVVRALGVLVCEGRIQGPPRGYKEGPHCAAPLQPLPNNHTCEKDNYLCDRYAILVRYIAERVAAGSYLCFEVLLCSDCPCGLAKSRCNDPMFSVSTMTPWQHSSEMLLEYWCIGVSPSKNQETMNYQGLYQAVRSRLYFSQVAAWWSRSKGTKPNYIVTRIVPYNEDHLRKFREPPTEHTFPLAACGDNSSMKVTVWALPRIEEVPVLNCPIHLPKEDEIEVARALSPTKSIPICSVSQTSEHLVLPALVDDRLQTPCNKPGKHHCRCEEEDGCPPSPSIRSNGERKRRRSLPCGPAEPSVSTAGTQPSSLPLVQETNNNAKEPTPKDQRNQDPEPKKPSNLSFDNLENRFRSQLNIEEREDGNTEKRYKLSLDKNDTKEEDDLILLDDCYFSDNRLLAKNKQALENVHRQMKNSRSKDPVNVVINPFADNPPGTSVQANYLNCTVHRKEPKKDINKMMSKLIFPEDEERLKSEEGGIFDWLSRVPGRVLGNVILEDGKSKVRSPEPRTLHRNLELSPREVDEVLAVLQTKVPSRRKVPQRSYKHREQPKREEELHNVNKADILLNAILRTTEEKKSEESSSGARPRSSLSSSCSTTSAVSSETSPSTSDEDDGFLPAVLNKKLGRIKQLFKREQERKPLRERRRRSSSGAHNSLNNSTNSLLQSCELEPLQDCVDDVPTIHNVAAVSRLEGPLVYDQSKTLYKEDEEDETVDRAVPSAIEQEQFRRSFENAASMVFHSRTGLPLTSSPAPLRRGSCCFDFDSSLNSVSSKRSALFELNTPPSPGAVSLEETDKEAENVCDNEDVARRRSSSRNRPTSHALLGNFEESALNGRLEPVSTVHGFTAEIGASGSFCPKHRKLPVTVFFYTLGDNDKVSSPYLAHINLGKKGYQVPRSGTIQVTLSNPLGTVVKMFVVLYDLSDMPPRSHTFLRQRTLRDKTLRYLIHLRFMSGKSGKIYLHTDVRMIICRKSDVDTASDFASEPPKELRSYIHGPTNPKFSPRC